MRILATGDWHYAEKPPRMRKPSYPADILAKLDEAWEIARENEVDLVVCPGDFFHRRDVGYHELLAIMRSIERSPCPVVGSLGNHDVPGGARSDVRRRAVGVLVESEYVRHLEANPVEAGGVCIQGRDWRPGGDGHGRPGYAGLGSEVARVHDSIVVRVTHGNLYRKPPQLIGFESTTPEQVLAECADPPDVLINGHIHGEVGVTWHRANGRKMLVVTPGALVRAALSHEDKDRRPAVALVEVIPGKKPRATLVELESAKPAAEVYLDPSEIVSAVIDHDEIKEFVEKLAEDWSASADLERVLDEVIVNWKEPLTDEAKEAARKLLRNAVVAQGR